MKLRLPPLERSIRDRVREEVNASDLLRSEYRQRRRSRWIDYWHSVWSMARHWLAVTSFVLLGPLLLCLFPLSLAHVGESNGIPHAVYDEPVLALHAMFMTAAVLVFIGGVARPGGGCLDFVLDAPRLVMFPSSAIGETQRRRLLLWRLFGICASLSVPIILYLAVARWTGPADLLMAGLCIAAHAMVMTAMALALQPRFSSRRRSLGVTGTAYALFTLWYAVFQLFPTFEVEPRYFTDVVFAILPNGWVNAAYYYGWLERNPLGLLFLIPLAAPAAYFLHSLRQSVTIKEIVFHGRFPIAVTLTDERTVPPLPRRGVPKPLDTGPIGEKTP